MGNDNPRPIDASEENRRQSISEYLSRLDSACDAFAIDRGRATRYASLIREFYESNKRTPDHQLAYFEGSELLDLHELWAPHFDEFPGVRERIGRTLEKGPILREAEDPSRNTNRPRNDAFSYLMAGILLNAHLDVVAVEGVLKCGASTHGDADSTLQHAGLLIDVQCKRPQSLSAFVARFKEAIDQIRADRRPKQQGIVAIDCSSAIRPDFGVLVRGDESEAYHDTQFHLRERLIPLLVTHLLPRVLGLILFARVPVRIEQVSPILASGGAPFTWIAPYTIRCVVGVVNAECLDPHLATSIFDSLPQSGHRVPTGG